MRVPHRRVHAVVWALLAPGLLVLVLWAAWSRPPGAVQQPANTPATGSAAP